MSEDKHTDLDISQYLPDLNKASTQETAAGVVSMASGFLPSLPGGAIDFVARSYGGLCKKDGVVALIKERFGHLICQAYGMAPERKDQLTTEQITAAIYDPNNPEFAELQDELKKLDRSLATGFSKHASNIIGGIAGMALFGPLGWVQGLLGGAAGGYLGDKFNQDIGDGEVRYISSVMMLEEVAPFLNKEKGGLDEAQAIAILVSRTRDSRFLAGIEKELGTTIEEALAEHNQLRSEGKERDSALARLVENSAQYRADLAALPNARQFPPDQSILKTLVTEINLGADPCGLVLGDVSRFYPRDQHLYAAHAHLGNMASPQFGPTGLGMAGAGRTTDEPGHLAV